MANELGHVGILAHSAEGAALCFRTICLEASAERGAYQHPDVTLDCIPMGRSMPAWESGDYATIREILAESVTRLARAGADFFVCPDNTAHIALEFPGPALALPGLHIAHAVADRAKLDGRKRVAILGTKYTMDGPVYPRALKERGLEFAIPNPEQRRRVNAIIFEELVEGIFTDASRNEYVEIIADLRAQGCDSVALVCTEIPLLVTADASPLPILDSTRLLARAALEVAAGRRPIPTWRGGPI